VIERCVDASVAAKWALKGERHRSKALALLRDSVAGGIVLIAPPFFASEVDSAIQKRLHDGTFTLAQARAAYARWDLAPVQIMDVPGLRQRAREIAEQFQQRTVYDATYAALAELRSCEFWPADKRFYDAVKAVLTFVKFLADYP
jgi:predicted nucleic acid-binding protein